LDGKTVTAFIKTLLAISKAVALTFPRRRKAWQKKFVWMA
jgi:hypothetical protein